MKVLIKAPAKLNLTLKVLGRRKDGFHDIESLMQAIALYDDVCVEWTPGGNAFDVEVSTQIEKGSPADIDDLGNDDWLNGKDNLAYKAAKLVHKKFSKLLENPTDSAKCNASENPADSDKYNESNTISLNGRLTISIIKRIPIAAGLAGGSADCAAVLTALEKLWTIPGPEIAKLAPELGSDVAFSYAAQHGMAAATARGRGEILQPAGVSELSCFTAPDGKARAAVSTNSEDFFFVLLNPGFGVSTPAVYDAWDAQTAGNIAAHGSRQCFNDLQDPAISLKPEIAEIIDKLWALEPAPQHVQLSGSGPTVFAVYPVAIDREKLKKCLQLQAPRAIIVEPLRNIHL